MAPLVRVYTPYSCITRNIATISLSAGIYEAEDSMVDDERTPVVDEMLLRTIFDRADIGLCLVAHDNRVLMANPEWLRSAGVTGELADVVGQDVLDLVPEVRDLAATLLARVRETGRVDLPRHRRGVEKLEMWWDGAISPVPMVGGVGALISTREVTAEVLATSTQEQLLQELKERNQHLLEKIRETNERLVIAVLRQSELVEQVRERNQKLAVASMAERLWGDEARRRAAELDAVLKSIVEGLVIYGPRGQIEYVNSAAERILGYSQSAWEAPLEERAALMGFQTADGRPFPTDELPVQRALRGGTVQGVVMGINVPGRGTIWVSASAAPNRSPSGRIFGAVATFVDVTAQRELQDQQDNLVELISQQLRTPLTATLGYAELIQRDPENVNLVRQNAAAVVDGSQRMNRMVRELVDLARLEAGRQVLNRMPLDLRSFALKLKDSRSEGAELGRVRVDIPENLASVTADPICLKRILVSLLGNALAQSPLDNEVLVSARQTDEDVVVSIVDSGAGISAEKLTSIFERGHLTEGSQKSGGIATSLYVTRMLVEAHGGRIWAESELSRGSKFSFSLPRG